MFSRSSDNTDLVTLHNSNINALQLTRQEHMSSLFFLLRDRQTRDGLRTGWWKMFLGSMGTSNHTDTRNYILGDKGGRNMNLISLFNLPQGALRSSPRFLWARKAQEYCSI